MKETYKIFSSVHEREHQLSFHEVVRDGFHTRVRSGIREYSFVRTDAGEGIMEKDQCRILNEGITQLYTVRKLKRHVGSGLPYTLRPYSEARYQAACVEQLLGSKILESAYYLGEKEALIRKFNHLAGHDRAWEWFNEDVEQYAGMECLGPRAEAGYRISETFERMREVKENSYE